MLKLKKWLILLILLLCFFFLPFKFKNTNRDITIKICTDGIFIYLNNFIGHLNPQLNAKYNDKPMINLNAHSIFAIYLEDAHNNFQFDQLELKILNNYYLEFFVNRTYFYLDDKEHCILEFINHSIDDEYHKIKTGDPCKFDNLCKNPIN